MSEPDDQERDDHEDGPERQPARRPDPSPLSPDLRLAIRRAYDVIGSAIRPEQVRVMQRAAEQFSRIVTPDVTAAVDQLRRSVAIPLLESPGWQQALQRAQDSLRRIYPGNWHGFDVPLEAVIGVAKEEGLALVWAPRGELVVQLLAAADADARRTLLAEHADDVLDDCAEMIGEVDHAALTAQRARLLEAVAAHQAGLHGPAQAMSAVVVTDLLQHVYRHGRLYKVRSSPLRLKEDDEQLLRDLKVAILVEAAVVAVANEGDVPPGAPTFNRHMSLHRVSDAAYSLPQALMALLLATGLLVEADLLLDVGVLSAE